MLSERRRRKPSASARLRLFLILANFEAARARKRDPAIAGALKLSVNQMPVPYEIHSCQALSLFFVHIFKNAGSTIRTNLHEACELAGGEAEAVHRYQSQPGPPSHGHLPLLPFPPSGFSVFTFVRDPISRFFSAYHEVKLRYAEMASHSCKTCLEGEEHQDFLRNFNSIPFTAADVRSEVNATVAELSASAAAGFSGVGTIFRNHFLPQRLFVTGADGSRFPAEAYHLEHLAEALADLYGKSGVLAAAAAAEVAGRTAGEHMRDSHQEGYALRRFQIGVEHLSPANLRDLCVVYAMDFCYFGLDLSVSPCSAYAAAVNQTCFAKDIAWGPPPLLPKALQLAGGDAAGGKAVAGEPAGGR